MNTTKDMIYNRRRTEAELMIFSRTAAVFIDFAPEGPRILRAMILIMQLGHATKSVSDASEHKLPKQAVEPCELQLRCRGTP